MAMSYGEVQKMRSHHPRRAHFKRSMKHAVIRRERQRARLDVAAVPQYRRMRGWED